MDKPWTYTSDSSSSCSSSSKLEQYLILAKIAFWLASYFIPGRIAFGADKIFLN